MTFSTAPKQRLSADPRDYFHFGRYKTPTILYPLLQNWGEVQDPSRSLPLITGQILVLDGHMYYSKKEWDLIVNSTIKALESKDTKYFDDFFVAARIHADANADFLMHAKKESSLKDIESVFLLYHNMEYPWLYVLPMCQAIEDWLKPKVPTDILPLFFTPSQPTILAEYQEKINGLAARVKKTKMKSSDLDKEVDSLLCEYPWVGMMHFWGEYNSPEKIAESLKKPLEMGSTPSFEKIPQEFKWLLEITRKATYYRQYFAELCAIGSYELYESFKRLSIDPNRAIWLTPEEFFEEYAEGKHTVSKEMISERKKAYGVSNSIITGKELQEMIREFIPEEMGEVKELRGTVASKGHATGKVKIILSPHDLGKMEEGDILVAHETTPDVVPAMQKAAAIVTDIGGLTSHAAIVSRELGKPCIIGTKIGSRVLKDGDMVDVDAEKGIVTVIT